MCWCCLASRPVAELLVIVPTRGRPHAIARVVEAWNTTGGWEDAELRFVVDEDDPTLDQYREAFKGAPLPDPAVRGPVHLTVADRWRPLVPKLNLAAVTWAPEFSAVGFAGDDHLPRTPGWAGRYVDVLAELGTGIVYGNDLIQGPNLPTQWAMTSDIITALGRMVPADVEHLYCDNAILDLGRTAGCIAYLPGVTVEHTHPLAGTAAMDAGYSRVNAPEQYAADRARYIQWRTELLPADAQAVKALMA